MLCVKVKIGLILPKNILKILPVFHMLTTFSKIFFFLAYDYTRFLQRIGQRWVSNLKSLTPI